MLADQLANRLDALNEDSIDTTEEMTTSGGTQSAEKQVTHTLAHAPNSKGGVRAPVTERTCVRPMGPMAALRLADSYRVQNSFRSEMTVPHEWPTAGVGRSPDANCKLGWQHLALRGRTAFFGMVVLDTAGGATSPQTY